MFWIDFKCTHSCFPQTMENKHISLQEVTLSSLFSQAILSFLFNLEITVFHMNLYKIFLFFFAWNMQGRLLYFLKYSTWGPPPRPLFMTIPCVSWTKYGKFSTLLLRKSKIIFYPNVNGPCFTFPLNYLIEWKPPWLFLQRFNNTCSTSLFFYGTQSCFPPFINL